MEILNPLPQTSTTTVVQSIASRPASSRWQKTTREKAHLAGGRDGRWERRDVSPNLEHASGTPATSAVPPSCSHTTTTWAPAHGAPTPSPAPLAPPTLTSKDRKLSGHLLTKFKLEHLPNQHEGAQGLPWTQTTHFSCPHWSPR